MEHKRVTLEQLLDALKPGVTLVTANHRLARQLRRAYDTRQQARGLVAWESPDILPWLPWLQRCWLDDAGLLLDPSAPVLLNTHQELLLWERVVAAATVEYPLLHVSATAQSACQAWHLRHDWELVLADGGEHTNEESKAFVNWAQDYERRCQDGRWLDLACLPGALAARLLKGRGGQAERLLVTGFDELTPAQSTLLRTMEAVGCPVSVVALAALDRSAPVRLALADTEEELNSAARWVRRMLNHGPAVRIGIVVPELATLRGQLERVFDEVLTPAAVLPAQASPRPYNLSLGPPLLEWPVIQTAFTALELARGPLPIERLSTLLRSPFTAGAEREVSQRALLELHLRSFHEPQVHLSTLERQTRMTRMAGHGCPVLAARLGAVLNEAPSWQESRPASAWAEVFSRTLALLGWPGERTLDSTEYQTVQAWRGLLVEFSSLDAVSAALTYAEALSRLRRLAAASAFQPRSADVPVQVLGILEAGGAQFDYLWVMGLHDGVWPAAPRPNPFLPIAVQRRHNLPHASADRELAFARALTGRLVGSAGEVVFSYPTRQGDCALRPSPLIVPVAEQTPERLGLSENADYARTVLAAGPPERLQTDTAPPVESVDDLSGGTAILQDQAACPFRAFAVHRLGAGEPGRVQAGLDARDRGRLVHGALQRVWSMLESHAGLCGRTPEQLDELVGVAVRQAVSEMARERSMTFTGRFAELEQWRLVRLVSGWLEEERRRSPFIVVSREQSRRVEVGGIPLKTRPDRVDRLLEGGLVIIDYKTGATSRSQWFGERPEEPQLPVYATTSEEPVDAILFARLRPGDMGFDGAARHGAVAPGLPAFAETREADAYGTWADLMTAWRQELSRLGEAFRAGHAEVAPKHYPRTCRYCPVRVLCRVGERAAGMQGREDG